VLQGGGFTFPSDDVGVENIEHFGHVMNEPGISNTRQTVAMAKQPGNPDSATSQFFINLADNSENLDNQNGGFTVFGRVVSGTMNIVDRIAALPRYNLNSPSNPDGPFGKVPLNEYEGGPVLKEHVVLSPQIVPVLQLRGDYNANGTVEQGDLDLVLLNWGDDALPLPLGWVNDLPSGAIDQNELDGVLLNWGEGGASGSAQAPAGVPEPRAVVLALIVVALRVTAWLRGAGGSSRSPRPS
jgi:cyclophilin family peptidyl-prolyl cis-trans isomerase